MGEYYHNNSKQLIHAEGQERTHIADCADVEKAHFLATAANAYGTSGFERVTNFHEAFGLPVNGPGYVPTIEERLLRGRLMLEEVLEHLLTGLGLTLVWHDEAEPDQEYYVNAEMLKNGSVKLMLEHEGAPYNPVETLDGLCDVKVIANGTGVAFGLPVPDADRLVYEANMAKLGPDGRPIINGVTPGYEGHPDNPELADSGFRHDLPIGKVLKPAGWQPADIAGLFD